MPLPLRFRTLFVVPLATVALALAGTPSVAAATHDRAVSREAPRAKPTKVRVTVKAPKNVLSGSRIAVAGRVTERPGGAGVATKVVIESMRFPGGSTSWQRVGTTRSKPDGTYRLKRRLISSLYLRARALPTRRTAGAPSGRVMACTRADQGHRRHPSHGRTRREDLRAGHDDTQPRRRLPQPPGVRRRP
ncbi:hypothetical protein [Nocardioides sp. W7]|uniref:hypothetical protein n=1 Tax=Nocardioides sp. W7 TaxID=2931390 RepID=UPI001FD2DD12|nr:hypothetical protein [Nocardioides sp. W7]